MAEKIKVVKSIYDSISFPEFKDVEGEEWNCPVFAQYSLMESADPNLPPPKPFVTFRKNHSTMIWEPVDEIELVP